MNNKIESGLYKTSDIDMVTALSMSFPIVDAQTSAAFSPRVVFSFEATEDLLEYVKLYRERKTVVEPKAFYFQLRDIRSRINDILDKQN